MNLLNIFTKKSSSILTGDLKPLGVKSTINVNGDFNSVWEHIHSVRKELYLK